MFAPFISGTKNVETDIKKKTGFVGEGFQESVTGIKTDFLNFTDELKPILFLIIAIIALLFLTNITD